MCLMSVAAFSFNGKAACPTEPCEPIRVMSYNVRLGIAKDGENSWEIRKIATPAMLEDLHPDVFGVQEAFQFQIDYILQECPEYRAVGVGRDDGSEKGEHMSVFYNSCRFKLLDWGTYWLSDTPDVPSKGWDAKYIRNATWTLLQDKVSGQKLFFVDTHLDNKGREAKSKGCALIIEKIHQMNPDGWPMVLVGDFNIGPDDVLHKELGALMKDARSTALDSDSKMSFNDFKGPKWMLDYIYYAGFSKCTNFKVADKSYDGIPFISDHYPVYADLCFACDCEDGPRDFIDSLMSRMTLEEKIGQMNQLVGPKLTGTASNSGVPGKIREGKVGSILNVKGEDILKLQRIAVQESRLGIPILFGLDVIHGYETCFPIPLAMACSWNTDAVEQASRIAGAEASRDGIAWTFTPMCDIARDPRWGRIAEGAGEDPYLGGEIAAAQVRGFQGKLDKPTDIAACVKHFALYGAPQGGRDYYTVDMSRVQMFNEYLWPYQAAVNAGALTAMSSFNEYESLPVTVHPYMLDTLLRNRMGFEGLLVTDYNAIKETIKHGAAANAAEAAVKAANAGVDMDMVSESFSEHLATAVRSGLVSMGIIDRACRRTLEVKEKLGLFADPYKYNRPEELRLNGSAENRAAAREMAAKSIVLLKNDRALLPLEGNRKIAVIGPLADLSLEMLGTWNIMPEKHRPVTLLEGLQNRFGEDKVSFARGCHVLEDAALEKKLSYHGDEERGRNVEAGKLRKEALRLAKKSDVIVAAMGELALMSGEGASRSDITIPEPQRSLLKELVATGKPVVLVVMAGRPLVMDWEDENVAAIVNAWHLGSEAGNAIADVLSGDVNPSGRLTASFPRNVGQIPVFYNHKNSGRPISSRSPYKRYTSSYMDVLNAPLYPFGYGLSYGKVNYGNLCLSADNAAIGTTVTVGVTLENPSEYDITETVQIYVRDNAASITRPVKELKAYKQVLVKAGETIVVELPLETSRLGFYGSDLNYVVEPGEFTIMAGPSSDSESLLKTKLTLK